MIGYQIIAPSSLVNGEGAFFVGLIRASLIRECVYMDIGKESVTEADDANLEE